MSAAREGTGSVVPPSPKREIPRPSFREPHGRVVINGIPIRFRPYAITPDDVYWIPTYVTRNIETRGWQVFFNRRPSKYRGWAGDNGRPMLTSLNEAWDLLMGALLNVQHRPDEDVGTRQRKATDTGEAGITVNIIRGSGIRSHKLKIRVLQRLKAPGNTSRTFYLDTFYISEQRFKADPEIYQSQFRDALRTAVAARRFYNEEYARSGPLLKPIRVEEVPDSFFPEAVPVDLQLADIFAAMNK